MFVMDELWAGKLCPSETAVHTGSEYRQLCRQLADKAEALHENMNDRDWELFEEYEEIFYSREAFIKKQFYLRLPSGRAYHAGHAGQ